MENRVPYTKPTVVDYGSLVELTADVEHINLSAGLIRAVAGAAVISQPLIPGGDSGSVLTAQGGDAGTGPGSGSVPTDGGGELPGAGTGTGGGDPGGAGSGGGGGGSGGGAGAGGSLAPVVSRRLPFTGFSVVMVAAVGAGMAAAGASLRARLSRAR